MQRLVYTPRVYAFIKDADGNIHDVSRYIVSGMVTRRLKAVSDVTLTLRNPKMLFTTPKKDGSPVFSPMDPITIYLRRVRNRPVRVFTGFLDKSVYLQLFPGVITLRASCTLKKLLYTFFDPALPYTQSFLAAYGWAPDQQNPGQWFSFTGLNEWGKTQNADGATYQKATGAKLADDGSIGQLLYATLKYIGHWRDEDIYIETLPEDLFVRLAALATEFEADNEQMKKEFEELMRRIIGDGGFGAASDADLSGLNVDGDVAKTVYNVGRALNAPTKHLMAAMETGLQESGMRNLDYSSDGLSKGWRQEQTALYPDPMNVPNSARRFFEECKSLDRPEYNEADLAYRVQRPGGYPDPSKNPYPKWRSKAQSLLRSLQRKTQDEDFQSGAAPGQASDPDRHQRSSTDNSSKGTDTNSDRNPGSTGKWVVPLESKWQSLGGVAAHMSRALGNWQSDNAIDMGAPPGTKWLAAEDGVISPNGLGWGDSSGSGVSTVYGYRLHLVGKSGNVYFYQHGASNIAARNTEVKKGDIIGEIGDYRSNGIPSHLHFAAKPPTNPEEVAKAGEIVNGGSNQTGGVGGGAAGVDPQEMASSAGAAGAFLATLNLPSMLESIEAVGLQGQKSLMNDKPLMPFVQQLCEAGLREFQSLPDGKFFAFYPDYFGELYHRAPYWEIDDIEILDGKIELTDDALVTHMYVVGDTTMSGNERLNSLFSSGVVTVFNAFMADSILDRTKPREARSKKQLKGGKGPKPVDKNDPRGMDTLLDKDEALAFLDRYGARPLVEDVPMIRHPYFEMFLAYQRFMLAWSKQFATTFTFTFMPELFPGGKVAFPDHGLQMYIEEVTHSWDYTSGFTTQAVLSAPSVLTDKNGNPVKEAKHLPPNMVKAIIAPAGRKKAPTKTKKPTMHRFTPNAWERDRPPLAPGPNGQLRPN